MGAPPSLEAENNNKDDDDDNSWINHDNKHAHLKHATTSHDDNNNNSSLSIYLSLVTQYLAVFMIDNAIFLAERCVADHPSSADACYLLALCYYRQGSYKRAQGLLSSSGTTTSTTTTSHPNAAMRYLAAQIALQLKDYTRAEQVLLKECRRNYQLAVRESATNTTTETKTTAFPSIDEWIVQTTPCPIPNGAAGLALLATICRKSNRNERAIQYYKMSLQLDPFLWTSFQALSELGVECDCEQVFGVAPMTTTTTSQSGATTAAATVDAPNKILTATKTPLQPIEATTTTTPAAAVMMHPSTAGPSNFRNNHHTTMMNTPGLTPIAVNSSTMVLPSLETPPQFSLASPPPTNNPLVLRRARDVAARHYYPPSPETPLTNVTQSMRYLRGLGMNESLLQRVAETTPTPQRHLFLGGSSSSSAVVVQSENHHHQQQQQQQHVGPSSSLLGSSMAPQANDTEKPAADPVADPVVAAILQVLATMGAAYQKQCQYQSREALAILQVLPVNHQLTGWVLHQQGRAYLEMNDFANARRSLEMMHSREPGRIQGLEILSTVYWQLKKEVELASLSQRIVDLDRLSPEAWCVVGNCFSLQKDHESALLFFKRSLQIDPDFTYTHTLCGHEYMANEDFEKAIACFRQALRIDPRHYNAWYGLGAIHHRQEKYDQAEYHFEKAVVINPNSSVLRCHLGIAQHANGKSYQALDTLASAFQLDPRNPQARFQRATIYSSLQRYQEALAELEKVRDAAPREATIHFAMGKVLKRLGRSEEAMKCFLTAMDLDPKDNQMIKSAMDKLDEPEVDEDNIAGF